MECIGMALNSGMCLTEALRKVDNFFGGERSAFLCWVPSLVLVEPSGTYYMGRALFLWELFRKESHCHYELWAIGDRQRCCLFLSSR